MYCLCLFVDILNAAATHSTFYCPCHECSFWKQLLSPSYTHSNGVLLPPTGNLFNCSLSTVVNGCDFEPSITMLLMCSTVYQMEQWCYCLLVCLESKHISSLNFNDKRFRLNVCWCPGRKPVDVCFTAHGSVYNRNNGSLLISAEARIIERLWSWICRCHCLILTGMIIYADVFPVQTVAMSSGQHRVGRNGAQLNEQ